MLTDKDIDKLTSILATKLDVEEINVRLDAIEETVQTTAVAIDKQVSINEDFRMELAATHGILTRHDGWIKQLAKKTETKLED